LMSAATVTLGFGRYQRSAWKPEMSPLWPQTSSPAS